MATSTVPSPLGPVVLTGSDDGLASLSFGPGRRRTRPGTSATTARSGAPPSSSSSGSPASGATSTCRWPWSARRSRYGSGSCCARCPYGTTTSYGVLAAELGSPGASRAVGTANARNRIGLVVPCHRVIGRDGTLTGYAGGLPTKRWLLAHEQAHAGAALF